MSDLDRLDDYALLQRSLDDPEAFGVFYARHLPVVVGFLLGRTRNREIAADLTGEVFASALAARRRYRPDRPDATAWLLTIARNTLADSLRRGQVADRARRALGLECLRLDDDALQRVEELAEVAAGWPRVQAALTALDEPERDAVVARVVDERDYTDIARELRCSEAVVRKRVSRGLARLRAALENAS